MPYPKGDKGVCSVCAVEISLKQDGTIPLHKTKLTNAHIQTPENRKKCTGSGKPPKGK